MKAQQVENLMRSAVEKAIQTKTVKDGFLIAIRAHIMLGTEGDIVVAHALEYDIVADGKTESEAKENILTALMDNISFAIQAGTLENIVTPAPIEYWQKFVNGTRVARKANPKFPEIKFPFGTNIIKEVEYAHAATC